MHRVFSARMIMVAVWMVSQSGAAAQDVTRLCDTNGDPHIEPVPCWDSDGAGLYGVVTLVGDQQVSISVRQLEGLWCDVTGYDDLQREIGTITVSADVGSMEDCFRNSWGACFDRSPIGRVEIMCWAPRVIR